MNLITIAVEGIILSGITVIRVIQIDENNLSHIKTIYNHNVK